MKETNHPTAVYILIVIAASVFFPMNGAVTLRLAILSSIYSVSTVSLLKKQNGMLKVLSLFRQKPNPKGNQNSENGVADAKTPGLEGKRFRPYVKYAATNLNRSHNQLHKKGLFVT